MREDCPGGRKHTPRRNGALKSERGNGMTYRPHSHIACNLKSRGEGTVNNSHVKV